MAIIRAMHTIQHVSAVPANAVTNVFHFSTGLPQPMASELDYIVAGIKEFFDVPAPTSAPAALAGLLSINLSSANRSIKLYNLADAKPRSPLRNDVSTMAGTGVSSFPHEVALVGSYRSFAQSGVPQRRRRGRLYLGPLTDQPQDVSRTGGDVRPSLFARETLVGAMKRLALRSAEASWVTLSTVDGFVGTVVGGFVDDAYDTQRRRGTEAVTRSIFSVP